MTVGQDAILRNNVGQDGILSLKLQAQEVCYE